MIKLLKLLCFLSEKKATLLWPTLFGALLFAALTASKDEVYTFKTTLYLNKEAVTSPVLQNASEQTHTKILNDTLTKESVIEAALTESGFFSSPSELEKAQMVKRFTDSTFLEVPHNAMVQIYYEGTKSEGVTDYLEALSYAFIKETLSPERLRIEQKLATLAEQVQYYSNKERNARIRLENEKQNGSNDQNIIAARFEIERALTQMELAQEDYDILLEDAKPLMSMTITGANDLLWPVEAPIMIATPSKEEMILQNTLLGALIGLMISFGLITWNQFKHTTITRDEDVLAGLGVRVLGRIPNLGHIHVDQGKMSIDLKPQNSKNS
ncbi:MAG: hypothetical protein VX730_05520 [Pseudomonadota bacterium]|nr:hypothetical protein [Pseudomonadota bacterium]